MKKKVKFCYDYEISIWVKSEPVIALSRDDFFSMSKKEINYAVSMLANRNGCFLVVDGELYDALIRSLNNVPDGKLLFGIKEDMNGNRWMEILMHKPDNTIACILLSDDGHEYELYEITE